MSEVTKAVTKTQVKSLYDNLRGQLEATKENSIFIKPSEITNPTTVSSNAASVINAAITKANTNGMHFVVVPAGEYWLTETVYLKSDVILKGCGMDATTLKIADDCDIDAIRVAAPTNNSGIMDLSIDGNRIQNYSTFVNGHHGNAINVWLHYGRIERVRTNWVYKHSLLLNYDTGTGDDGLGFDQEHQNDMGNLNKVLWCDFRDSLLQGVMWGWRTMDSWMCYTNIGSHAANLYLEGGTSRFIGNHFDGDGDNGAGPEYNVYCGDGCKAMVFESNIFENTQKENIFFRQPSYSNQTMTITIANNIIRTCSKSQNEQYANIKISGYSSSVPATEIVISGNQILNPDTNANHGYAGIHLLYCENSKVVGNAFFNVGDDEVLLDNTCENVLDDGKMSEEMSSLLTEINLCNTAITPEYISPYRYVHSGLSNNGKIVTIKKDTNFENNPYIFFGKNYFPKSDYFTGNNVKKEGLAIESDGYIIHITGTATAGTEYSIINPETETKYFPFPSDLHEGDKLNLHIFAKRNVSYSSLKVTVYIYNSSKSQLSSKNARPAADSIYASFTDFEVPSGAAYISFALQWNTGEVHDNYFFPVLVKKTTVVNSSLTFTDGYAMLESDNITHDIFCAPHKCTVKNNLPIKTYIDKNNEEDVIRENIVTPEMFGAWGDYVHNDIDSIQACINYATANKKSVYGGGWYNISAPINISGDYLDIKLNTLFYPGTDCAVIMTGKFSNIEITSIYSNAGSGFRLYSSSETIHNHIHLARIYAQKNGIELIKGNNSLVGNDFYFDFVRCGSTYASIYHSPWAENPNMLTYFNNNNFTGGKLTGGKWGVQNAKDVETFTTCMFEDCENCILTETGAIKIISPRFSEVHNVSRSLDENGYLIPDKSLIVAVRPPLVDGHAVGDVPARFYMPLPEEYTYVTAFDVSQVPTQRLYNGNLTTYSKSSPPPTPVYTEINTRGGHAIAPYFMIFVNHILIKEPYRRLTKHLTTSDVGYTADYRTLKEANGDLIEFKIYERFIVDDEGCEYTLPPSYDNIAFNKFYVEQSNGSYCTFKDWRGTNVFDGSNYGDGIYEVTITLREGTVGDYYDNQNQVFEVRRVSTGELIDTMPHLP